LAANILKLSKRYKLKN